MLTTPELIIALERRGVLPPGDVARVRQLYENSPTEFVPRVMFKWLVSRGRLTNEQAEKLLTFEDATSAAAALDRVLGLNDKLELAADDDGDFDEDTKDMPAEARDDLTLAPPGTAAFADSPREPRKTLIPSRQPAAPAASATPAPPKPAAAELLDELLGGAVGANPLGLPPPTLRMPTARNRWESPLMLVGGGVLLILIGLGAFLVWRVVREGGDAALAAAEESYNQGGYATAVERYDRFLADYPRHRSVGTALVHRGMARLRLAVEGGADVARSLEIARTVLPEIAAQSEFAASKADLSALLPDLAERLAGQAAEKPDEAALTQAVEARKLIDKYVGATDAVAPRLQQIDALIAASERRQLRQTRLAATVADIRRAAAARDLNQAAKARTLLVAEFPDTAGEPELAEAMAALAETKRQAVRYAALDEPAETAAGPSPFVRKVTLARRRGEAVADAGDAAFALIEGTLFAYDAADGRIRWTRYVGFDAGLPVVVAAGRRRDVLLYDGVERALVCLAASDGALRWRQPRAASPTLLVERDLVYATIDDRLVVVEAESGRVTGEVRFPTTLAGPAVSDPRERVRYVFGRGDDLYVVANDDFRCLQAYYLGHAGGAVAVGPTCVGPYVLTAENVGDRTRLRLLETAADGAGLKQVAERILDGRTTLPPQVSQRLAVVVTNGGPVELFDLSGAGDRKPLEPVARLTAAADPIVRRHFLFRGTQLWLGGKGLTRYEFQANLGKLTPLGSVLDDRTTLQPPQPVGNTVICRTQPSDFLQPASVAALDAQRGTVLWETSQLGELVDPPQLAADGATLTVVSRQGLVIDVGPEATSVDRASAEFGGEVAGGSAALPDGGRVYVVEDSAGAGQTLVTLEPPGTMPRFVRTAVLGPITSPQTFRDGVVAATGRELLQWLDPRTGARKAEPFPAPASSNDKGSGLAVALVAGDAVFALHHGIAYRLAVVEGPPPYLKLQSEVEPKNPVGAIGDTVYAAHGGEELAAYALADLRPGASWKFRGARTWQTATLGLHLAALTRLEPAAQRKELLVALTGSGELAWQTTLERSVGASRFFLPVAAGDDWLLVDDHADVVRLDATTGQVKSRKSYGLPLVAPPAVVGNRLVLATQAGELLWIDQP